MTRLSVEKNDLIELIFTRWKTSLARRDRSAKSLKPNFQDLFDSWKEEGGASFDDLYNDWLPKAVKAHFPEQSIMRKTYKKLKNVLGDKTEKEFVDAWLKGIETAGNELFFETFKHEKLDADKRSVSYGNMSEKEYKAQRRYADQFPILDTTELEKQWHDSQYNLNIDDLIKNVLGKDDNETNA